MNKFLTYLLLAIGYLSSKFSINGRIKLGALIGFVLRRLSRKREDITYDNISKAFPDKPKNEVSNIVKGSYKNLGIVMIEVLTLKYLSDEEIKKYVQFENAELITETYKQGKGLILLSGHFGNWEYLAYAAGLISKIPILIIVKEQQNRFMDRILNAYRTKSGNRVVSMSGAGREIIKTLLKGEAIAILADQNARKGEDIFVDFFGRPAATFESPSALALRYKAPIIYGFAVRSDGGTYRVRLEKLEYEDLQNNEGGIKELTQRHVKILEEAIRQNPHLWAWQHRRWKSLPDER